MRGVAFCWVNNSFLKQKIGFVFGGNNNNENSSYDPITRENVTRYNKRYTMSIFEETFDIFAAFKSIQQAFFLNDTNFLKIELQLVKI